MIDQVEIHSKCRKESKDRIEAANLLGIYFSELPDKDQAWQDLHMLIQDENRWVRDESAKALISAFSQVPDKNIAWKDLHTLAHDSDRNVRLTAAKALISAFSQVSDKDQAWQDIVSLTLDEDDFVRREAAKDLISVFIQVPDKNIAWKDLIKLTQDEYCWVREDSAKSLIPAFGLVPDKDQAWNDLHKLSLNEDRWSREYAVKALVSVFRQIPNKDQAWQDLIKLTKDNDRTVRWTAAKALISAFGQVPGKDRTWQDLQKLTQEEDSYVRMYAYHSLGKASILKATEAEANDKAKLKSELEAAVAYFEKSSQEDWLGPARFCHPFYRTYLAIIFQETEENEVQRYLVEAKEAVGKSESKDELFKAVENLAGALREVQRLKDRPMREVLRDLKSYEWYCSQAESYMSSAEDKAPGAVKLLRRGNPWIKRSIDVTIKEIQDCARLICKASYDRGLEARYFCDPIKEASISLSSEDLTKILNASNEFVSLLKEKCQLLPEGDRELVQNQLDGVNRTGSIPEKLNGIRVVVKFFLSRIQSDSEFIRRLEMMNKKMDVMRTDLVSLKDSILGRFESNEKNMLSAIFERLNEDNLKIISAILDAINKERIPRELIIEILNTVRNLVAEMKAMQTKIQDTEMVKSLTDWEEVVNSPELGIENMIKVTIPLIPFLLTYEGSYKFETGMKLDSAWNKLRSFVRR